MNHLFHELIAKGHVVIYMDNILIFTVTIEEHWQIIQEVLQILADNKLYLKPEKCDFKKLEIKYLGLCIAYDHIMMDLIKIQGVANWPVPHNITNVWSFLRFTNSYRCFIHNFSDMAKPLNALLQKDAKWEWSDIQFKAFEHLKLLLCSKPILVFPMEDHTFLVEADSSGYATGAVLSQMQDSEKWHPVAYISKSLSPAEHNYDIYDKEMLAVIRALEQWHHYLEGAKHPVQILTNHKNLEYFMMAQKLNQCQACWSLFLSHFDIKMMHHPGKSSAKPDLLLRHSDHKEGVENNNNDIILLKPEFSSKNSQIAAAL